MAEWLRSVSLRDGERLIIGPLGILVVPERPGPGDNNDAVQWAAILADAFAGNRFGIFSVRLDDELGELRIGIVLPEYEVREEMDDGELSARTTPEQLPIVVLVPADDEGEPLARGTLHAELKRVVDKHAGKARLQYVTRDRVNAYRRLFGF